MHGDGGHWGGEGGGGDALFGAAGRPGAVKASMCERGGGGEPCSPTYHPEKDTIWEWGICMLLHT